LVYGLPRFLFSFVTQAEVSHHKIEQNGTGEPPQSSEQEIQSPELIYQSPHLARSQYSQHLTLTVCPDVCLSHSFILASFLFLNGIEPFFGRHFSMWRSTKRCSSIFDLGPLMPKIYSPKFAQNRL